MDADSTAIFYNRPEDLLAIGVIVSIILLIVGIRWRRFLSALGRSRLIILVLALGLFGPGFENIYGPWGERDAFVRTVESREELLKRLPHPAAHAPNLMEGLSVERVYEAAKALLAHK